MQMEIKDCIFLMIMRKYKSSRDKSLFY